MSQPPAEMVGVTMEEPLAGRQVRPQTPDSPGRVLVVDDLPGMDGLEVGRRLRARWPIGGKLIQLALREYDLLVFFLQNPRQAFTREQLLAEVWGWTFGATPTVTVCVRRLREKLEPDPTFPQRILTVRGVGYRYEPEAA